MAAWFVYVFVGIAVAFTLSRIPKPQQRKPLVEEDLNIPKAEDGAEFGVIFGTVTIKAPNVVWTGDFKTEAVQKKGGKK